MRAQLVPRCIWKVGEVWAKSKNVWEEVNKGLGEGKSISRASIIMFLDKMEGQGVLGSRDATGKGGQHKIYYPLMGEKGYLKYLIKTMVDSMMRNFPEETNEVLRKY